MYNFLFLFLFLLILVRYIGRVNISSACELVHRPIHQLDFRAIILRSKHPSYLPTYLPAYLSSKQKNNEILKAPKQSEVCSKI